MKILILGGTGAMGKHLSHLLSQQGHQVYITSRSHHRNLENISYLTCNAHDLPSVISILKQNKWDVLVDFMVYNTSEFKNRYNIFLSSVGQYIFLSSARVYADTGEFLITEDSPRLLDISSDKALLESDEYAITKARQEDLLQNSEYKNWSIVRPYITYSENRLQLGILEKEAWLYRAIHGRPVVFYEDVASCQTTLTYGEDVAKGICAIMENPRTTSEIYNITTEDYLKWADVLDVYRQTLLLQKNIDLSVKWLPLAINDIVPSAQYPIRYDRLFNRRFNNAKIKRLCPTLKFVKPKSGLAQCLESFLDKQEFLAISYSMEALRDRYSKAATPMSEILNMNERLKYLFFRYLPYPIMRKLIK